MAITLTRPDHEIQQMPLVELVYEILKTQKEPLYFRDIMKEIQVLRKLTDDEVADVIARVYTEINIDGRFLCVGQNVWGLNRWYPTEKPSERLNGKKFVRKTGDAFGDDDDEEEEDYEESDVLETEDIDYDAPAADDEESFDESSDDDEEEALTEDEEYEEEEETLFDEEDDEDEEEED